MIQTEPHTVEDSVDAGPPPSSITEEMMNDDAQISEEVDESIDGGPPLVSMVDEIGLYDSEVIETEQEQSVTDTGAPPTTLIDEFEHLGVEVSEESPVDEREVIDSGPPPSWLIDELEESVLE